MAKKTTRATKKTAKKTVKARARAVPLDTGRVASHVRMIMDPCNAVITPTAYRGKDGFITRVNGYRAMPSGATFQCGIFAYWPRFNRIYAFGADTSGSGFSIDFWNATYSAEGPGGPFFGTNAAETRPVAACLTGVYLGTELDRQGQVIQGVVPYRSITGTVTIDFLAQLAQRTQRTPDGVVETKWIPSPSDEEYMSNPTSNPNTIGVADDNIVFIAYRGFAAGKVNVTAKFTGIYEWQPFYNLGISAPTPNTPDPPGGIERVRSALATFGNWWLDAGSLMDSAVSAAGATVRGARAVARGTSMFLGAARAVPLLM